MTIKTTAMQLTTLFTLGFPVAQASLSQPVIFGIEEEHLRTTSGHADPLAPYRPLAAWLQKKAG